MDSRYGGGRGFTKNLVRLLRLKIVMYLPNLILKANDNILVNILIILIKTDASVVHQEQKHCSNFSTSLYFYLIDVNLVDKRVTSQA